MAGEWINYLDAGMGGVCNTYSGDKWNKVRRCSLNPVLASTE
jgi:hypothetical protein